MSLGNLGLAEIDLELGIFPGDKEYAQLETCTILEYTVFNLSSDWSLCKSWECKAEFLEKAVELEKTMLGAMSHT